MIQLPKVTNHQLYRLDKNCTVIDIGANVGLVTECLARTGAYVICFEPDIKALTQLKKVSARYKNIEVHECAAGIKEKEVKIHSATISKHISKNLVMYRLSPFIDSFLFGNSNTFCLPLANNDSLKLCERTKHIEH